MTTHHPQHSTNRAPAGLEPRILRTHRLITQGRTQTVHCTDDDILAKIREVARRQCGTQMVSIHQLGRELGLDEHSHEDRMWLVRSLLRMDGQGEIGLSPLEHPQRLLPVQQPWFAANALGIPCHEVCALRAEHPAARELRLVQTLQEEQREGMTPEAFIKAAADGLQTMARRHHAVLSKAAAQSRAFRVQPAPMPAA